MKESEISNQIAYRGAAYPLSFENEETKPIVLEALSSGKISTVVAMMAATTLTTVKIKVNYKDRYMVVTSPFTSSHFNAMTKQEFEEDLRESLDHFFEHEFNGLKERYNQLHA